MVSHRISLVARAGAGIALALAWGGAIADTQVVEQVLDRVVVHNRDVGLDMQFNDPRVLVDGKQDFVPFNLVEETGLRSCQLTGSRGLYCLDGFEVVRWQKPEEGGAGVEQFSCDNPRLQLDTRRMDTCSAMTVAQTGDIWIAGRRGSAYVLIKLWEQDPGIACGQRLAAMPDDSDARGELDATRFCYEEYAAGRPLLLKLAIVEGEELERFDPGVAGLTVGQRPVVLGLDERNAVTLFGPNQNQVNDLAVGKTTWTLNGNERLLDLDLLQLPNGAATGDTVDNYLVATTSTGRVLARTTDVLPAGMLRVTSDAFNVVDDRGSSPRPSTCPLTTQGFGIVASSNSGRVYVTDRSYCRTLALQAPAGTASAPFCGFVNVDAASPSAERVCGAQPDTTDLTLSTASVAPDAVTLAPGISVNLVECEKNGTCTLIPNTDPAGKPYARLENLLLNRPTGSAEPARMVLFQVRNIPDCRYIPTDRECIGKNAIVPVPGLPAALAAQAGNQYLDVAKLLPAEVTDQFADKGGLPPLLISPMFRGRDDNPARPYTFDAFFGIPEDGVYFREMFDGYLNVAKLIGTGEPDSRCDRGGATGTANLVNWDVVTYVSEKFIAAGGPYGLDTTSETGKYRYVDTLTNVGCGSTKSGIVNWSMVAYGLEMAYAAPGVEKPDEIFVRLIEKLFGDLEQTQDKLACGKDVDGDGTSPLGGPDSTVCQNLKSELEFVRVKFDKCVAATRDPKFSASNENCQSFKTQLEQYLKFVDALPPAYPAELDPANRIGSLEARTRTILHVYDERFLPSIPRGGFPQ